MSEHRHGRRLLVHLFQLTVIALGSYMLANLWNAANASKDHAIALPIDAHVPLLPWTTVIYLGFFVLYIVPARMAYGNQARMDELDRIVPMMVGWTVLHSVFFVLVPAEVPRSVTPSEHGCLRPFVTATIRGTHGRAFTWCTSSCWPAWWTDGPPSKTV